MESNFQPLIADGRDGLDLNKLLVISQDSHAEERAWRVVIAKRITDHTPGGHEIGLPLLVERERPVTMPAYYGLLTPSA